MSNYDYLLKVLLCGGRAPGAEVGCGKSSLLIRYTDDTFSPAAITTIGIDFKIRSRDVNGKTIKMQIWDTAGQERFRTIARSYYRGAHVIIMCADMSLPAEAIISELGSSFNEVKQYASDGVPVVIVGCKSDLCTDRSVRGAIGEFAENHGINQHVYFTSAKNGEGIEEAFDAVARAGVKHLEDNPSPALVSRSENNNKDKERENKKSSKKSAGGSLGGWRNKASKKTTSQNDDE